MRTKINVEELEKKIDFESVSNRLLELTKNGDLKRKKTIGSLLDRVKPALLQARANKVSFEALTKFLIASGIPISEPTLRAYLREDKPTKKQKQKKQTAEENLSVKSKAEPKPEAPGELLAGRKLPPRLARKLL